MKLINALNNSNPDSVPVSSSNQFLDFYKTSRSKGSQISSTSMNDLSIEELSKYGLSTQGKLNPINQSDSKLFLSNDIGGDPTGIDALSTDSDLRKITNIESLMKYFPFKGYKSLRGFCMHSSHLWQLKLTPYISKYYPVPSTYFTPELPNSRFDYRKGWLPVVNYSFEQGALDSMQIPLYSKSSISVPIGFELNNEFSFSVLEDDRMSFSGFMHDYVNTIYDPKDNSVADFKEVSFVCKLLMYQQNFNLIGEFNLIIVPITYSSSYAGEEDAAEIITQVGCSVVGELRNSAIKEDSYNFNRIKTIVK